MAKTWTDNQTRAISAREDDVLVAAGAGSGKTGVLVERFLGIVRDSLAGLLPPERRAETGDILVITFTEKATKEMKGRIVQELLAAGLREQRREVETAYISTIHGFCSRLLKENPFEAGVDPEFTVLDETEARRILHSAFESVIERAYALNNETITELVAAAQDERVFGSDLRDPLAALEESLRVVLARVRGAGWRQAHVEEAMRGGRETVLLRIRAPVCTRINAVLADLHAFRESLALLGAGVMGTLESIRRDLIARIDALAPLPEAAGWERIAAAIGEVQEVARITVRGSRARANASPNEIRVQEIMTRIRLSAEAAKELYQLQAEREEQAELLCRRFWTLLLETWATYQETKHGQGVLDNDDLQSEAVHLLETSPGVLARYRKRFRYIMVDEFQDTNPLQKRLIDLLHGTSIHVVGPSEVEGDRTPERPNARTPDHHPNSLFVVGDVQQSIYGFRGADAQIFQEMERAFRRQNTGAHVALAENFRARPEILRFVNYLFGQVWRGAATPFQPLEPGARHADKPWPSLEILLTRESGRAYVSTEARALAVRIRRMVDGRELHITDCGHPRFGEPLSYGDIAILLRGLTDIEKYESVFLEQDVPYFVVGGGRGYYARREVRDVMNVLTVLDTPLDDIALVATLRSPMVGLDVRTLYRLARFARREEKYAPLYPAVPAFLDGEEIAGDDVEALRSFYRLIEDLRTKEDRLPVGQLLERILAGTQYDARLLVRPSGRRRLANVRKLLQMANAASTHGVTDFIRRLREIERISDREGDAPTEEEAADVVRLMTIHKAKGLEFPIVFVADMARALGHPENSLFLADPSSLALGCKIGDYMSAPYRTIAAQRKQAEREEANRLLYVALTRAREHLVLCGAVQGAGRDNWASMVFGHLAVTLPTQPETYVGPAGIAMRLTPMESLSAPDYSPGLASAGGVGSNVEAGSGGSICQSE